MTKDRKCSNISDPKDPTEKTTRFGKRKKDRTCNSNFLDVSKFQSARTENGYTEQCIKRFYNKAHFVKLSHG